MADQDDGAGKPKAKTKTKLFIVGGAAAALLLAGGGYFAFAGGGGHGEAKEQHEASAAPAHGEAATPSAAFLDLPQMTVNLATPEQDKQRYVTLSVALEFDKPEMAEAVKPMMPRVLDSFQTHLRELRPDDIRGSSGAYKLKEELLRRVNTAVAPARVDAVLFKDLVIQ
ncbi:MAG: flagellar basal body-associated FliL family protein [Hansschlegelia sp.]